MSLRDKPTYLSHPVWNTLKLLSKSESSELRKVSIDEIADRILGHALAGVIPNVCDKLAIQEKQREKTEKELVEGLRK